jgi:plastocyanin
VPRLPIVAAAILVLAAVALAPRAGAPATGTPTAGTPPAGTPTAGTPPAATPAAGPTVRVEIVAYDYEPGGVRVAVGTTVRWVNRDGVSHTATDAGGAFDSGPLALGGAFAHRFDEPGTYRYGCAFHLEMGGTVLVARSP